MVSLGIECIYHTSAPNRKCLTLIGAVGCICRPWIRMNTSCSPTRNLWWLVWSFSFLERMCWHMLFISITYWIIFDHPGCRRMSQDFCRVHPTMVRLPFWLAIMIYKLKSSAQWKCAIQRKAYGGLFLAWISQVKYALTSSWMAISMLLEALEEQNQSCWHV